MVVSDALAFAFVLVINRASLPYLHLRRARATLSETIIWGRCRGLLGRSALISPSNLDFVASVALQRLG
eukprot:5209698-Pleurochrysis_carterae.AAC.1